MNIRSRFINPVLEKEFRLRMRTVRSPLALLAYLAVIGLLAFAFLYVETQNRGPAGFTPETSRMLFYFLSGAQLVLICFMAPGLTAGSISGEREKQTLSMLLTTPQSSAAIILSKLAASLSFMLLVVFSTLPIYSIVFLYGGISPGQLLSVFGMYVLVMLMLGALGVLFSTLFQKTVVAVIVTYGSGLFLYVLTGLAAMFLMAVSGAQLRFQAGLLLGLNPLSTMIGMFEANFTNEFFQASFAGLQMWHIFVASHLIIAAFAVWMAVRRLRPSAP